MPDLRFFPPRKERRVLDVVLEHFPFPLAITYQRLHEEMDRREPVAVVWRVRDAIESTIRFTASVETASELAAAPEGDAVRAIAQTLLNRQGVAIGGWRQILDDALRPVEPYARDDRLHESERPLSDLVNVFRKPGRKPERTSVWRSVWDYTGWRNETIGHGVFGDRAAYAKDASKWLGLLNEFLWALQPVLARWRLVEVQADGTEIEWHGVDDLQLVTRHEHVPLGEPNPLFLVPKDLRQGGRLPLMPLLSIQRCDTCSQPAAFFFDKLRKEKRTYLLEYARGHQNRKDEWDEIAAWANLLPPGFDWSQTTEDQDESARIALAMFRSFDDEFVRPDYLADAIWAVTERESSGYIHLVGEAGTGKSFLARGLAAEGPHHAAFVFRYHLRPGDLVDHRTFITRLQDAIAQRDPPLAVKPNNPEQVVGVTEMRQSFARYLEPLLNPRNNLQRVLIVIDGLDELPEIDHRAATITDLLPNPGDLPDNCFVLLTSRETVRLVVRRMLDRVAEYTTNLRIDPLAAGNQAVLRTWLSGNLPQPFRTSPNLDKVLERSRGIFLYAFHLSHALESGAYADADTLPDATEFYPAHLARIRELAGDELYEQVYLKTLLLLTAAYWPVTRDQFVLRWGIPGDRLDTALHDLRDFLRIQRGPAWNQSLHDDGEPRYELTHEDFARYIKRDPELSEKLRLAHRSIAQAALTRFAGQWWTADPHDAGDLCDLLHTPNHLHAARLDAAPDDLGYAEARHSAGLVAYGMARYEIAVALYDRTSTALSNHVEAGRDELANDLARALMNRARVLEQDRSTVDSALVDYQEAIGLRDQFLCSGMAHLLPVLLQTIRYRAGTLIELQRWDAAAADVRRFLDHILAASEAGVVADRVGQELGALVGTLRAGSQPGQKEIVNQLGPWEHQVRQWLDGSEG